MHTSNPSVRPRPDTCYWALPPVAEQWPAWVALEHALWTCRRDETARLPVTAVKCADCTVWQARPTFPERPRR